jgi:hypothetical protein
MHQHYQMGRRAAKRRKRGTGKRTQCHGREFR